MARLAHPVRWHAENERTLQVEQQLGDHGGVLCNARHASTLLHQPDARHRLARLRAHFGERVKDADEIFRPQQVSKYRNKMIR